jgi:C_GCAxxG_C_C family probable redox protein
MSHLEKIAVGTFKSGSNCSQSVLTSYAEKLNFDKDFAHSVSCGFGAGMGKLQDTCGAVTGAFMVLGIYNCRKYKDSQVQREMTYKMIQEFNNKFISLHGTTYCRSLLNSDLNTEEGHKYAKDNNLFELVCEKCVSDAVKIIESLVNENQQ